MSDSSSKRTVLVVDDEDAVRGMLLSALEFDGFDAIGAANGAEAVARAQEHQATLRLVLLDVNLPGEPSGPDAWRALRKMRKDLPIMVMSGDPKDATDAGLPSSPFLAKPFRLDALSKTITDLIG